MPRPTAAQLAYGSATVVFSTVALLLLTRTTNGVAVAAIGIASLGLGLLVALALPIRRGTTQAGTAQGATAASAAPDGLTHHVRDSRAHSGAETRVGEHSLRR
ncbi:hypothetical protein ACIQ7Q_12315 [Streptomyces sp. NPDC096176]|uniref:hypothetical protein n=1 Tax=Streptomyces sp. NPDC096176 TaxID=3366079 RepID=UPI00382F3928